MNCYEINISCPFQYNFMFGRGVTVWSLWVWSEAWYIFWDSLLISSFSFCSLFSFIDQSSSSKAQSTPFCWSEEMLRSWMTDGEGSITPVGSLQHYADGCTDFVDWWGLQASSPLLGGKRRMKSLIYRPNQWADFSVHLTKINAGFVHIRWDWVSSR